MGSFKTAGRIVGVLFLAQGIVAPLANFALLGPAIAPPGFLTNAAANATEVNAAVLLMLVTGAIWLGIATSAWPVFRQYSRTLALWFLALSVVIFSGVVFEGVALRSMLALSQEYAKAGGADASLFQASAAVVRSLRNSAHYTNLLLSGGAFLVLYGVLFRFALIPRALSGFGLVTVALLIAGALIPLFGQRTVMLLFMPMGLSQLALVLWLLTRGFEDRHQRISAAPAGAALP